MKQLEQLLSELHYRPGWRFQLEVLRQQLILRIMTTGYDSYHPELGQHYHTSHIFPVPQTPPPSWQRWVLDQILLVETHEAMEFFRVGEFHPFAPLHSRTAGTYYTIMEQPPP